jgi:hypothetical protein
MMALAIIVPTATVVASSRPAVASAMLVPRLIVAAGENASCGFSISSPPTSATRTPASPTPSPCARCSPGSTREA